jgi:tetratricopeptide (TPR) repeat protein
MTVSRSAQKNGSIRVCYAPWVGVATVCALLVAGCGPGDSQGGLEHAAATDTAKVLDVPFPQLSSFDPSIQNQLREGRANLEGALQRPDITELELGLAFGRAGMLYQAYSLHDTAEICFRNAVTLDPAEFRWPYFLGHVHDANREPEQAIDSLERALEIRPDYLPALIQLAQVQLDENRLEDAESLFRGALELDAGCAAAWLGLGKIASSRRDFATAVQHLEAARRLAPAATEINYPLGVAYRGLGELEKAASFLEQRGPVRAEVNDPVMGEVRGLTRGVQTFQNRGSAYFEEGQYELARAEFERAVEADPADPGARINLGLTLAILGDGAQARRALEEALRLESDNVTAHYNLGTLLAKQGEDRPAVEHLEAALRVNPDLLEARLNLGNALRRLGQFEAALGHYRQVVEGDPGNGAARLSEALTLVRLHRYTEARTRLEQSHAALPEDLAILNALARVLAAAPDDAARDRQLAVELGKKLAVEQLSIDSAVTLAMVAAENGEFEPALRLQRQAVEWARRLGRASRLPALLEDLRRYEQRQPSRTPWRDDDPALSPRPLRSPG